MFVVQLGHMAFLMEILAQYGEIGNFRLSEGLDSPTAEKNTFTYVSSLRSRSFHYKPFCPPCREGWGEAPMLHPVLTLPVEGLGDSLASTWAPFWCLGMDSW